METLYPIFYGTRLVTLDVLKATFEPYMHPEFARRVFNLIVREGGKLGIGSGYRAPGKQPDGKPGFAQPGMSFHEGQEFPSGRYFAALDMVVVNPGRVHRAPTWDEIPVQGQKLAIDYGVHANVGTPGAKGAESWHIQPSELDGYGNWISRGRFDIQYNYPILVDTPRPTPPQPPVPPTQPATKEIVVEFKSRNLSEGAIGTDVKFFQRQLNEIAGQGLLLDGYYGPKMTEAVKNWQNFFKVDADGVPFVVDGVLGAKTQRSIIEVSLQAA